MKYIDTSTARGRLRDAGMPENMVQSFIFMYDGEHSVPENVIDYACRIFISNPDWQTGEQIMIIFNNATGSHGIFDVRKFYHQIAPFAHKWGFGADKIQQDIAAYDKEMKDYASARISRNVAADKMSNPGLMLTNTDTIMNACADRRGKYYRAAIDFAVWHQLGMKTEPSTLAILARCIENNGIDIRRIMRLSTSDAECAVVSRQDGKTIKPKINLQYVKYANEIYRFFAENKVKIRHCATKNTDSNLGFLNGFYNICKKWDGWSWSVPSVKFEMPTVKTPIRELAAFVINEITCKLPIGVRRAMAHVAYYEMAKYISDESERYEYIFDMLVRINDTKNRQKK